MQKVKVVDLESNVKQHMKDLFAGQVAGFSRFGEAGYLIPSHFEDVADDIKNMEVKTDDVFLLGYPRSGTSWTDAMVWLLNNNLDYEAASKTQKAERWVYIEWHIYKKLIEMGQLLSGNVPECISIMNDASFSKMKSPRHMKSHLALSLLPAGLLDRAKAVYVARDPRDVAVSQFHFCTMFKCHSYTGDFKTFWELFRKNQVPWSQHLSHVTEAWNVRHHPNMMFIFYEELIKDLPGMLVRISKFLGKEYTDVEMEKLGEYMGFNTFKKNKRATFFFADVPELVNPNSEPYFRKGKSNAWRDYFDEEMTEQAESWMREQLKNTDLKFPQ